MGVLLTALVLLENNSPSTTSTFFCLDSLNPSLVHFYTVLTTLEESATALMNICTQHREQINGSGWDSCVVVTLSTLCQ